MVPGNKYIRYDTTKNMLLILVPQFAGLREINFKPDHYSNNPQLNL